MLRETPKFTEDFPRLSESLNMGICCVINCLVDEPKILKQSQSLLTGSGLWSQLYKNSLSKELENVLNLMGNYFEQKQSWQSLKSEYPQWSSLLDNINKFWYLPEQHDHNYKNLTRLFEKVGTTKLAAIFYQIGEGSVPKSLFDKFSTNKSEYILFKKRIYRRKNVGDYVKELRDELEFFFFGTVNIGGINMSRFTALIILLVVFTGGLTLGIISQDLIASSRTAQVVKNNKTESNQEKSREISLFSENNSSPLSKRQEGNYKITNLAIEAIVNDLKKQIIVQAQNNALPPKSNLDFYKDINNINSKGIVISCIKDTLRLPSYFQYSDIGKHDAKWQEFSHAIKEYQKNKGATRRNADGVIYLQGKTQTWLEEDIRKCLNFS